MSRNQRCQWVLGIACILHAAPATAQRPLRLTPGERLAVDNTRAEVTERARASIEALFSRLCPGRCELVKVDVEMKEPQPLMEVAPGFEPIGSGGVYSAEVAKLSAVVLLDSKLPNGFRTNVPRMLQHRLSPLAPLVTVRPELLAFPEPQLPPMPPPMVDPQPLPARAPTPNPAPQAPPTGETAESKPVLEALAPWMGPMALLLLLFALAVALIAILRRSRDAKWAQKAAAEQVVEKQRARASAHDLVEQLGRSRSLRNRVLRQWIVDDEKSVATVVRLAGADLIADLRADAELRDKLHAVSVQVARMTSPPSDDEVQRLNGELEARLVAAELMHKEDSLAHHWDFLEGISTADLTRAVAGCTPPERAYVLTRLSPTLRSAYVRSLDDAERQSLVVATSSETLSKQQAIDLASRLRREVAAINHVTDEHATRAALITEMLRPLAWGEQESLLEELRKQQPEVAREVMAQVVFDATYLVTPDAILLDAIHTTPVAETAFFLGSAREEVRDRIISVTPPTTRAAIESELGLELLPSADEVARAREEFGTHVREALRRDGYDLARLNSQALFKSVHAVEKGRAIA